MSLKRLSQKNYENLPLAELTDFSKFRHNTSIRDTIYAERGVEGVADFLVQQHIIETYQHDPNIIHQPLLVRLAKHHHPEQIAQAIAQAWLDDAQTFTLRKVGLVEKIRQTHHCRYAIV